MNRKSIFVFCSLLLIIASCATPPAAQVEPVTEEQSANTEAPQQTATTIPTDVPTFTPTLEPTATNTPEPSPTPEPTATATPLPKPISADNADRLVLVTSFDLDRKFLAHHRSNWGVGRWNPDGSLIALETDLGIDIVDGTTLDFVAEFPDFIPVDFLADGKLAARKGVELHLLDLVNNSSESVYSFAAVPAVIAVSQDGNTVVYVIGPRNYAKVDLVSGEREEFEILRRLNYIELVDLTFSPDGVWLYVTGKLALVRQGLTTQVLETSLLEAVTGSENFTFRPAAPPNFNFHDPHLLYYLATDANIIRFMRATNDGLSEFIQTTVAGRWSVWEYAADGKCQIGSNANALAYAAVPDASKVGVIYFVPYHTCPDDRWTISSQLILYDTSDPVNNETVWENTGQFTRNFAFSPLDDTFFTISSDQVVRLWSAINGEQLVERAYTLESEPKLDPANKHLYSPAVEQINILDLTTQTVSGQLANPENENGFAYIRKVGIGQFVDSQMLLELGFTSVGGATSGEWQKSDTISVDRATATEIRRFPEAQDCYLTPNGSRMLCKAVTGRAAEFNPPTGPFSRGEYFHIYETETGELLQSISLENAAHTALSPDGELYYTCRAETKTFNLAPVAGEGAVSQYLFPCQAAIFLPDGKTILLAEGTLVDLETKEARGNLAFAESLADFGFFLVHPQGDMILINNVIYDLNSGALLIELLTDGEVIDAFFSTDGLTLTTLTQHTVAEWQVQP